MLIASAASAAQADIVAVGTLGPGVGLTVQTPAPGTLVTAGFIAANGLPDGIAFAEQQDVTLTADLGLDTGGVLPAGTRVSSYFVGFDSLTPSNEFTFVTLNSRILGIEFRDAGNLPLSDFLGLPTLTYNTGCTLCGFDPGDFVGIFGRSAVFDSGFAFPGDYARIIAAPVPEPSAWALLLIGCAGVGAAIRRRRAAASA